MTNNADNIIDYETTDILYDTLEDDFLDIIDEFIKSSDDLTLKIKQLSDQNINSIDPLIALIHTLKGSSGNVGALLLSEICGKLENSLRDKEPVNILEQINQIEQIYSQTRSEYLRVFKKAS